MNETDEGVTRWRRVADKIRASVADGSIGDRLPPETDLAESYGVNRHTVRRAMEWRRVRLEKQRLSEIVALYEISQTFTSTLDTATAVREIVRLLWRRFSPRSLSLSLLHPQDDELELLAQRGSAIDCRPGTRARVYGYDETAILRAHTDLVGEERGIDAAREIAKVVEGDARVDLQLAEHLLGLRGIAIDELLREPLADLQRDQLLLRTVVDVAFQPPALLVLCGHEALLGCLQVGQARPQLFGQSFVPKHEPGL